MVSPEAGVNRQETMDDITVILSVVGKALLLTAGNGMGKTTIAREMARRMEVNKNTTLSTCVLAGAARRESADLRLERRDAVCRLQGNQYTWNAQRHERSAGWMARTWYYRLDPSDS
jgi:F0F1-type ATP synthase beta subunit